MKFRICTIMVAMLAIVGCSTFEIKSNADADNERKTALLYDKLIEGEAPNTAQLTLFMSKMPKGGDLHNHYSGSIYAETYLDWVKDAGYWIDKETLHISKVKTDTSLSVDELRSDTSLYRTLLTRWSDNDYQNHYHSQPPPDQNFFDTFGYFGPIAQNYNQGLMILKERAIKENVSFIEVMLKSVGYSYSDTSFDEHIRKNASPESVWAHLDEMSSKMDADDGFKTKIDAFITTMEAAHKGIDDDRFMMRYQTYTSRNSPPSIVFSGLYSAFKAVDQSDLLVGVNIVGPENGVVAIKDYALHMQMFAYLHEKFPNVNRSLHAGELTLGMVRPKNLTFHISQAIQVAKAQRIGHGVDLPYEEDPVGLLQEIKENAAVEICLTSNEFILGVKGNTHPYLIYSAYGVPMVICTDDSGVSRNNLTGEYVLLAERYKPSYKAIKAYVYNSIHHSFLSKEDKDSLLRSLDLRFESFEAEMSEYSASMMK
ncbi:adenosine deaminase [Desulfoluna butyratoxydans]|uniref:adenosine deaminase n=1 Tax=Desulfoluna butyratoxydans TaxID=231438 RepID=A0A4U8YPC6_9BACT|nr:adenosine deaminase [Desulfoluna butyratoxydans]VFQ45297.1 metal-dependent hydrolase [Desulfoluna butyratoxydans]